MTDTTQVFIVKGYGDGRSAEQILRSCGYLPPDKETSILHLAWHFGASTQMMSDRRDVTFEYVTFDHSPSPREVLNAFAARNLERPTREDVVRFAEAFPGEVNENSLIFYHEPIGTRGYLLVLSFWGNARRLAYTWLGSRHGSSARFPGRRRE